MAATIAVLNPDMSITSMHCRFNTTPQYLGPILRQRFCTQQTVNQLFLFGSILAPGLEIGPPHLNEIVPQEVLMGLGSVPKWMTFQNRDCNEFISNVHVKDVAQWRNICATEQFNYLFILSEWWYCAFDDAELTKL